MAVAETADSVAETADPVAETANPVAETADSVAETAVKHANPIMRNLRFWKNFLWNDSSWIKIWLPGLS